MPRTEPCFCRASNWAPVEPESNALCGFSQVNFHRNHFISTIVFFVGKLISSYKKCDQHLRSISAQQVSECLSCTCGRLHRRSGMPLAMELTPRIPAPASYCSGLHLLNPEENEEPSSRGHRKCGPQRHLCCLKQSCNDGHHRRLPVRFTGYQLPHKEWEAQ